jgi:hypothetical protein
MKKCKYILQEINFFGKKVREIQCYPIDKPWPIFQLSNYEMVANQIKVDIFNSKYKEFERLCKELDIKYERKGEICYEGYVISLDDFMKIEMYLRITGEI